MLGKLVFGGTPYLKLRRDNGCRTAGESGGRGQSPRTPVAGASQALLKIVENIP